MGIQTPEITDDSRSGISTSELGSEWEESESGSQHALRKSDSLAKSSSKVLTLDEIIKNYVRTMHIPPVTDWRELSDSEEEKDKGPHDDEEHDFKAPIDLLNQEYDSSSVGRLEGQSTDDWQSLFKEKLAASSKTPEEKYRVCLLEVHAYGTYYHMPYEEMALSNVDQCRGCDPLGELGRCVCCGGASFLSPACKLDKIHAKQRLLKEARVYNLMEAGREFTETELLEWDSSERNAARICRYGSAEDD